MPTMLRRKKFKKLAYELLGKEYMLEKRPSRALEKRRNKLLQEEIGYSRYYPYS